MSNVRRFTPRPKTPPPPPPRKRLSWARSGWLPFALLLGAAVLLVALGVGSAGAGLGALGVVIVGALLHQRG